MLIGYVRVSTAEQNAARQESLMAGLGVDKVYIDIASGHNSRREKLTEMLEFVREGDAVVVESISRFARNTRDLLELTDLLERKGVQFISRKEAIDTGTPAGKFMLTIFGAVAELEREYMLCRQKEGIKEAQKAGKYRGRKPIQIDQSRFKKLYCRWKNDEITAAEMSRYLGLSASTFYRRVREYESQNNIQV